MSPSTPLIWVAFSCIGSVAHAQIEAPTAWRTNATSILGVGSLEPESLRLASGRTSGFAEGVVPLPENATWIVSFNIRTDEAVNIPSEYVDVFLDGVFFTRVSNSPPLTNYPQRYVYTGSMLSYRFEFSSPSTTFSDHLVVAPGTAVLCQADLTSSAVPGFPGYGVPNGVLSNEDFFYYLTQFAAGNLAIADLTTTAVAGQPGYGTPDGILNNEDFFFYLTLFSNGC